LRERGLIEKSLRAETTGDRRKSSPPFLNRSRALRLSQSGVAPRDQ
jgi:hypothetical protein